MPLQLSFAPEILHVRPWPDDVVDHLGYDPRSSYVEDFWLGVLGPSTVWLLRRLAAGFDYCPDGFELDLPETARSLGLGDRSGRNSPFIRSINRTVQFGVARLSGEDELSVRRRLPPLSRTQVARLSPAMRERHDRWQEDQVREAATDQQLRRAKRLALSLLALESDYGSVERQLLRWRYPASVARDAVAWAVAQSCMGDDEDLRDPGPAADPPACADPGAGTATSQRPLASGE